jgi:hypothetical protein
LGSSFDKPSLANLPFILLGVRVRDYYSRHYDNQEEQHHQRNKPSGVLRKCDSSGTESGGTKWKRK